MRVELTRMLEDMKDLSFERRVERRRLDRTGQISWATSYHFVIDPNGRGGFDESLLEINGRAPTTSEVRSHRRKARFESHWRQVLDGSQLEDERASQAEGLGVLAAVLFLADLEYLGEETRDGVPCHRIRIVPSTRAARSTEAERVAAAAGGSLWIAREGYALVRAELSITRAVKISLMTFSKVEATYQAIPFGGAFMPGTLDVRSSYDAKVVHRRHHNTYVYSGYEKARP